MEHVILSNIIFQHKIQTCKRRIPINEVRKLTRKDKEVRRDRSIKNKNTVKKRGNNRIIQLKKIEKINNITHKEIDI